MQDGAPPQAVFLVKTFLLRTFCEDRVISRGYKIKWASWSQDFTSADFWRWGYLMWLVYRSAPSTLTELKDAIQQIVSEIHSDLQCSVVTGVVTRLTCSILCGGGHVEQLKLK